MNRLISFDFAGTLAQRNFARNAGWEFSYPDTIRAIKILKLTHPDVYFAVCTNGDVSHPTDTLEKNRLRHTFMHEPSGTSLILGGHTQVSVMQEITAPVKQSVRDRLRGVPVRNEVQQVPVTRTLGPKPLPDMLHYAMEICQIADPAQVVHIGDDVEDAKMAENAGTQFIGVWPLTEVSYMSMEALLARATQIIR
jgi:hypothetical protein